jgi:putative colanic acid biosynthesis acetyltransferase WcaF
MVQNTAFRYSFHTWSGWRAFLLRCFGAKIGRSCIIRRTVKVYYPWQLEIGDLVIVGDAVNLYCLGKITLRDRCMVSQEAYLCAGTHDYTRLDLPLVTKPITVGEEAWVCARAFIGPGVTVGEGAVVGACAVVMKDVAPWKIVAGNRAEVVGERRLQE